MLRVIAVLSALTLGGCVESQEQLALQAKTDDTACQSFGARPGSDVYVQCRMSQQQQRAQIKAAALANGPDTCTKIGNTVSCY